MVNILTIPGEENSNVILLLKNKYKPNKTEERLKIIENINSIEPILKSNKKYWYIILLNKSRIFLKKNGIISLNGLKEEKWFW